MKTPEIATVLLATLIASITLILLLVIFNPKDDTDTDTGRSGLYLYTDALTGCQYLGGGRNNITPRVNGAGKHIGCKDGNFN